MRLFDKKAEKTVLIALLMSIPVMILVLWRENGKIGTTEIAIAATTLVIGVVVMFLIKWYSNKS